MCVCVLSKRVRAMGPYGATYGAIWAYVLGGSNAVDIGADLKVPGCSAEVWGLPKFGDGL